MYVKYPEEKIMIIEKKYISWCVGTRGHSAHVLDMIRLIVGSHLLAMGILNPLAVGIKCPPPMGGFLRSESGYEVHASRYITAV